MVDCFAAPHHLDVVRQVVVVEQASDLVYYSLDVKLQNQILVQAVEMVECPFADFVPLD